MAGKKSETMVGFENGFNIDIDDGFIDFTINNDKNKILRINPSDLAAYTRMQELIEKIKDGSVKENATLTEILNLDKSIREDLGDALNDPNAADVLIGKQSCFSTNRNGEIILVAALEALANVYESGVKKYESDVEKSIKKYTDKYTPQDHLSKKRK